MNIWWTADWRDNIIEILCYTKNGYRKIATLKTPKIPKINEEVRIECTSYKVHDIEYRCNEDSVLEHILIF